MARIFIDGFEAGDLKLWSGQGGSPVVATGISGMDGTYCANLNDSSRYIQRSLPEAGEYYVAFRWKPTSGNALAIVNFINGTNVLGWLRGVPGDVLKVYRSSSANSLMASGNITIVYGSVYLIEIYYKPLDSGGIFQVKLNGILEIDYTGDTTPGASTIDAIRFGKWDNAACGGFYIDNIVIDDAAWPGNTRIQAIVPTGVGNSTQWTSSAGDNYACVDEVPANEADYVETNTVGNLDQYAAGDLSGDIGNIYAVQIQALAIAEGNPAPKNLQLALRTGGSDYPSGDKAVPSGSVQLCHLWEQNPDTEAGWQASEINAMEIGVKAAA